MTTVAVTGVSGYLGGALIRRLADDPEVDSIVGIDVLEPRVWPEKMHFVRLDIRDPDLVKAIHGADCVVHLAFLLDGGRDPDLAYDVNVGGVRNLLSAMEGAGAAHLVYPSSAWVYGAHPDNQVPLTEESPRRPLAGSTLAQHKSHCEAEIGLWQAHHPEVGVAVLRLALVFGPHVENAFSRVLEGPVILSAQGFAPDLSVIHEDDAASALHFAVSQRLTGVYNACADNAISRSELVALAGRREVMLSQAALTRLMRVMHKAGLLDITPAELAFHLHSTAMSSARLQAAGWTPAHGTSDTLAAAISAHAGYLSVGRVRGTRAQWVRAALGGFLALFGGLVAVRAWVRGRRPRPPTTG